MRKMKRKAIGWWLCFVGGMCMACSDDDYGGKTTISGIVMDSESNENVSFIGR